MFPLQSFLDSSLEVPAIVSPTNGSATAFFYFSVNGRLNVHITVSRNKCSKLTVHDNMGDVVTSNNVNILSYSVLTILLEGMYSLIAVKYIELMRCTPPFPLKL